MTINDNAKKIVKREYSILVRFSRFLKYHFLILIRKKDSPENIAHGMAIGIAVGFLPIIPLQALIAIVTCSLFKKNRLAGLVGTNVFTNAFMAIPVFYLIHYIGKLFIDVDVSYHALQDKFINFSMSSLAEFGIKLYLAIFLGGVVLAIVFYWPTFVVTKKLVVHHREKLAKNRLKKFQN